MNKDYDVLVLGAGPAGYVCAIRAAQLGLKVAVIDRWQDAQGNPRLGGTCLNAGCIPSKALLESSELYEQMRHQAKIHGIYCKQVTLDLQQMQQRKEKMVQELTSGIAWLFKKHKIDWITGSGTLLPDKQIEIRQGKQHKQTLCAHSIVLASGSSPVEIPAAPLYKDIIVDSSGALEWQQVPKKIAVIGAGVIGLELGSVWRRLGSEVIMLEAQNRFLPMVDQDIARQALKLFRKQGLDIRLDARVLATSIENKQVRIDYQDNQGKQQLEVERIIVAVGRRPNTDNLAQAEAGLIIDEDGCVHIDEERGGTSIPGVYAIGDIVRGPMLAHKGSEEGIAVAQRIAGLKSYVNYDVIPSVIYTLPEIAMVGKSEEQLRQMGIPFKTGRFPFSANGRARALEQAEGMIKIISHRESDRILGVHILGAQASELIAQAVIAMEFEASSEDLTETIFAHPTLSEALHEAAMDIEGRAIHY